MEELDEPLGGATTAVEALAADVGRRFLAYLEMLQPPETPAAVGRGTRTSTGPWRASAAVSPEDAEEGAPGADAAEDDARPARPAAGLRAAAHRGGGRDAISYLLTGLVQLDLAARQELLEIPDTTARLHRLDGHLAREQHLLKRHLRPMALDLELLGLRKN